MKIERGVYSTKDLTKMLGEATSIYRKLDKGDLIKIGRGFYSTPDIDYKSALFKIAAKYYEEAVVSKSTILFEYGLTDYQGDNIDLDVPRESSYRLDTDLFNFHRVAGSRSVGVVKKVFAGQRCFAYSPERAVFDVLFIENSIGNLAREVCKKYVEKFEFKQEELTELSLSFGAKGKELLNLLLALSNKNNIY